MNDKLILISLFGSLSVVEKVEVNDYIFWKLMDKSERLTALLFALSIYDEKYNSIIYQKAIQVMNRI